MFLARAAADRDRRVESGRARQSNAGGSGAFPQVRLVVHAECGTKALLNGAFDGYRNAEAALAGRLLGSFGPGMLVEVPPTATSCPGVWGAMPPPRRLTCCGGSATRSPCPRSNVSCRWRLPVGVEPTFVHRGLPAGTAVVTCCSCLFGHRRTNATSAMASCSPILCRWNSNALWYASIKSRFSASRVFSECTRVL